MASPLYLAPPARCRQGCRANRPPVHFQRPHRRREDQGNSEPDPHEALLARLIVQPKARELIVGVADDPTFGPVIVFGQGGTAVEVINDKALALPPLDFGESHQQKSERSQIIITNGLHFGAFDKSDEAMLNDYEELIGLLRTARRSRWISATSCCRFWRKSRRAWRNRSSRSGAIRRSIAGWCARRRCRF